MVSLADRRQERVMRALKDLPGKAGLKQDLGRIREGRKSGVSGGVMRPAKGSTSGLGGKRCS